MKKRPRIKFIYIRYILPPVMMALILLSMLIPSYRYVVDKALGEIVSSFKLLGDNFEASRQVVFAATAQDAVDLLFSQTAMLLIIVFWLLFFLAFAVSVYSCYVAIRYFLSYDEAVKEKSRTLFVTLVPNRIFLCVIYALCVPITLFPYILPVLCDKIYSQYIGMVLVAPDALMTSVLCTVLMITLCIISSFFEKRTELDIFKKRKDFEKNDMEEDTRHEDAFESAQTSEQNEMIRRILLGTKNEGNTENTDKTED